MKKVILPILLLILACTSIYSQTLHLYGGNNNDTYLGCLNCDKFNSNSVWNAFGTYGSKFSSNSIWNAFGTYGSKFNYYSPWNAYATNPPVIFDSQGNFYGYFTINAYKDKRADFGLALNMYKYHELIMDDVSKWYEKLF